MLPSSCLYVSKATPTTINNPVPPIDTDVGKLVKLENIIGKPAITTKNVAPKTVNLVNTLVIYALVSSPGLIPGIYPPFSCKFFANSSGFNWINV